MEPTIIKVIQIAQKPVQNGRLKRLLRAVDPQPYTYGSDEDLWLFVRTRILAPLANSLCYSSCTIVCMRFLFTLLYIFRVLASLGGASTWLHDKPVFYETLSTSVERVL